MTPQLASHISQNENRLGIIQHRRRLIDLQTICWHFLQWTRCVGLILTSRRCVGLNLWCHRDVLVRFDDVITLLLLVNREDDSIVQQLSATAKLWRLNENVVTMATTTFDLKTSSYINYYIFFLRSSDLYRTSIQRRMLIWKFSLQIWGPRSQNHLKFTSLIIIIRVI